MAIMEKQYFYGLWHLIVWLDEKQACYLPGINFSNDYVCPFYDKDGKKASIVYVILSVVIFVIFNHPFSNSFSELI